MKKVITESVKALAHTPQYKMHKYFARRPYNVFNNLINHYSDEHDTVLDIFCGGGVTIFESCKLKRNAIGIDLNPLATFITKMQMFNGNIFELENYVNSFIINKVEPLNIHYQIDDIICNWIEWSYIVECPNCQSEIILTEKNKIKNGIYKCTNTNCINSTGIARTKCTAKSEFPIRIKYTYKNSTKTKTIDNNLAKRILEQQETLNKINKYTYPNFEIPQNWDRQKEDKLFEKGIVNYSDLFSKRNLYILSNIFFEIQNERKLGHKYADYLFFIFSSTLRYTNKMSKVTENWENGNPTCMDKHAYYLPNTFIENNVISVFKDRAKAIIKGCHYSAKELPTDCHENSFMYFNKNTTDYNIINCSSDELPIPDNSIDVIITDPPYGSNVQYAELSVVWNAWLQLYSNLDSYIYRDKEAVSNRKSNYEGAKNENDYERLLYGIFREAYRVLKKDSYMVFTFNNKNLNVWLAMLKAVAKSGFKLAENGVLFQDYISSYKNTSHLKYEGNVQGDFIYSFIKTDKQINNNLNIRSLEQVIEISVLTAIKKAFKDNDSICSEILYKYVFTELASNLMNLILFVQNENRNLNEIQFDEKCVDKHLEKYLTYEKGLWRKRNDHIQ